MTPEDLIQFSGSDTLIRHPMFRNYTYTEGVKFLAENAGAYWLLDIIFSASPRDEDFQVWTLIVRPDRSATVVCDDGNENVLYQQEVPFTDFPLDEIRLYLEYETLMLPGER